MTVQGLWINTRMCAQAVDACVYYGCRHGTLMARVEQHQPPMSFERLASKLFEFSEGSVEKQTKECGCVQRTVTLKEGAREISATETTTRHCKTHARPGTFTEAPKLVRELLERIHGVSDSWRAHIIETASDEEFANFAVRFLPSPSKEGLLEWLNRARNGSFCKIKSACGCTIYKALKTACAASIPDRALLRSERRCSHEYSDTEPRERQVR